MKTLAEKFEGDILKYIEDELYGLVRHGLEETLMMQIRVEAERHAPAVLADLRRTIEGEKTVKHLRVFYDKYVRLISSSLKIE